MQLAAKPIIIKADKVLWSSGCCSGMAIWQKLCWWGTQPAEICTVLQASAPHSAAADTLFLTFPGAMRQTVRDGHEAESSPGFTKHPSGTLQLHQRRQLVGFRGRHFWEHFAGSWGSWGQVSVPRQLRDRKARGRGSLRSGERQEGSGSAASCSGWWDLTSAQFPYD